MRDGRDTPAAGEAGPGAAAVALWQLGSGLSNVVLGWPLIGAVAHTAGAAAWVTLLTLLITRARHSFAGAAAVHTPGSVKCALRS